VGPIEARLKQIIADVCQEHQADIEELEVLPDHVHLLVSVDPPYGIHRLMKLIKGRSSRLLRQECPELKRKLPTLWTNSYFVSTTGRAPLSIIKHYIEQQNMSNKTYQYRLYLTRKQETTLTRWLALCCETFNAALQERRDAYRMVGKSIGFSHQCAELPECREVRPDLAEVPSQVLQDVVKRVDLAFDGFYRRLAEGQKPGYPRFKTRFRYDSMTFKQYGNSFSVEASQKKNRGMLILAKLGHVKMVMHRPLQGTRDFSHREANPNREMVCEHLL